MTGHCHFSCPYLGDIKQSNGALLFQWFISFDNHNLSIPRIPHLSSPNFVELPSVTSFFKMGSNQDSKRTQGHRTEGTTASMSNKESFHAARRPYDFQSSAISRAGIGAQFTDRSGTGFEAERSSGHPYPENLDFVNPNLEDNQDHTTARNIKDRSKVALSRTEGLTCFLPWKQKV